MRFAQKRIGLIVWGFIALLVFLVPMWRVRAVRQWQSPVVDVLIAPTPQTSEIVNPSQRFGLSPAEETVAARRFSDDVAVALASINKAEFVQKFNALQNPVFLLPASTSREKAALQARVELVRPRLLKMTDDYFARYDDLERRFPGSNLVRAQRLRDTMVGTLNLDEKSVWPANISAPPPDYALAASVWLSPQGHEAALRVAHEGARREPDNAFFPWMEAVLEFGARRNDNALLAIERAGRCARFNDYGLKTVASRLDVLRRLRATGWEDDFTEFALFPFPHFAKMRSAARACMGQMRIARRRGDRERAFRFAAAMSRAGSVVARSEENILICSLVGQAICAITWRGAGEGEPGAPKAASAMGADETQRQEILKANRQHDAEFFAAMARAHGQNELAREVESTFRELDLQELAQASTSSPVAIPARIEQLAKAYWLASQLLRMSLVGAILWLFGWALTRRRGEDVVRRRAPMLLASMFCIGATGALLVSALSLSPSLHGLFELLVGDSPAPELPPSLSVVRDSWWLLVALLWFVLVFAGAFKVAAHPKEARLTSWNWKWVVVATGVCALLVWFFYQAPPSDLSFYCLLIVTGLVAIGASVGSIARTRGEMRVLAVCLVGAFWTGLLGFSTGTGPGEMPFYSGFAMIAAGVLTLATLLLLLILALRKGKNMASDARAIAFELAARLRLAAATFALCCVLSYFGIALWTIPVERETRALLDRQLQIGEVAVLREQLKQNPPRLPQ